MKVILIWVTVLGVMVVCIVGCGSDENSIIEENSQATNQEVISQATNQEVMTLRVKKALAEARAC